MLSARWMLGCEWCSSSSSSTFIATIVFLCFCSAVHRRSRSMSCDMTSGRLPPLSVCFVPCPSMRQEKECGRRGRREKMIRCEGMIWMPPAAPSSDRTTDGCRGCRWGISSGYNTGHPGCGDFGYEALSVATLWRRRAHTHTHTYIEA